MRAAVIYLLGLYKSSKSFISYGGAKSFQLFTPSFGHQFHPAIGQISHCAGQFKSHRHLLDGVAKTDSLHSSAINNGQTAASGIWF